MTLFCSQVNYEGQPRGILQLLRPTRLIYSRVKPIIYANTRHGMERSAGFTLQVNQNARQLALLTESDLNVIAEQLSPHENLLAFFGYSPKPPELPRSPTTS